ncbi:hypothetical protein QAD02_020688 [Eretmocerus hayati]|uniref:Uncharacterized protein n=1 Tax=Eretmocerus hayati TaxID=131215 RepID=A0ACC2PMR9_9HYME|nr:hypothetical protein QAD02_020688 [Eretmocerus hayati]
MQLPMSLSGQNSGVYYYLWRRCHREAEEVGFAEPTRRKTVAADVEESLTELQQTQLQRLEQSTVIDNDYLLAWEALRSYRIQLFKKLLLDEIFEKIPGLATAQGLELANFKLQQNVSYLLLAHLMGSYRCALKRMKGKSKRDATWTNSLNNLAENIKNLQKQKDDLKATYAAHGFELTPYGIVVGKLDNIKSTHVVIGSHTWNIVGQNPLSRAVDLCFESVIALQECFPQASTKDGSFLETKVYKIRNGPDSSLSELCGKVGEFIKRTKKLVFATGVTIQKPLKTIRLPLAHALKILFELPGVLEQTLNYMKVLYAEKNVVSNIIQGRLWNTKHQPGARKNLNRIPIILTFDDVETGSALGRHAGEQKLGALYASLPNLPPHLVAKMMHIFLSTIFYSKNRIECGNEAVFCRAIDELNALADHGITVNVDGQNHDLFFDTPLLVGDNAGLNALFEMNESFIAKYFCRCCRATLEQCRCFTIEHENLLRTKKNYEEDLANQNHGLKGIPFRKLSVPENQSFDLMHDFAEGTLRDTVEKVLTSLILVKKTLDLALVNHHIETFNFGEVESNRPRPLYVEYCKNKTEVEVMKCNQKIKVKQSASEMLCLGRYLGLMIGDLIKNKKDEHWRVYRYVRQIAGIITSPRHTGTHVYDLRDKIRSHHQLYNTLYPKLQKPKGHFITHAPRLTLENGPSVTNWAMPFERKHQDLREVASNTKCRKNTPLTIAIRNQLQLSYMKECCENVMTDVDLGVVDSTCDVQHELKVSSPTLSDDPESEAYSNIHICGKNYKKGTVFLVDLNDNGPEFVKVHSIHKFHNKLYFYVCTIRVMDFNTHYHAYEVEDNNRPDKLVCIDDVPRYGPVLMVEKLNCHFVATRFDI